MIILMYQAWQQSESGFVRQPFVNLLMSRFHLTKEQAKELYEKSIPPSDRL